MLRFLPAACAVLCSGCLFFPPLVDDCQPITTCARLDLAPYCELDTTCSTPASMKVVTTKDAPEQTGAFVGLHPGDELSIPTDALPLWARHAATLTIQAEAALGSFIERSALHVLLDGDETACDRTPTDLGITFTCETLGDVATIAVVYDAADEGVPKPASFTLRIRVEETVCTQAEEFCLR